MKYFGYGANRDPDMMEAIIGRKPEGYPAVLGEHELCIQTWRKIPPKVRKILKQDWGKDFRTYCIRPQRGGRVAGMVWEITEEERRLIDNWEMNGLWYEPVEVLTRRGDYAEERAATEMINDPAVNQVIRSLGYQTFLNPKEKMIEVAKKVRQLT